MKLKVFILLLCLSVYYFDILAAVDVCRRIEKKSGCCKKTMTKKSSPDKCPSTPGDDCTKNCITCPQFYTAIFSPMIISIAVYSVPHTRVFANYNETLTSEFYAKAWKPPDHII